MKLPLIPHDKANHVIYGAAICLPLLLILTPAWAFVFATLVGLAKEVYDEVSNKGTPDWYDLLATSIGAAAIFIATKF